ETLKNLSRVSAAAEARWLLTRPGAGEAAGRRRRQARGHGCGVGCARPAGAPPVLAEPRRRFQQVASFLTKLARALRGAPRRSAMKVDRQFLTLLLSLGFAIALISKGGTYIAEQILLAAHAEEAPAESLAAQLRRQGHRCEGPVGAERDAGRSKPDEAVWVVRCANATYRMRLVPHMAAQVEQI